MHGARIARDTVQTTYGATVATYSDSDSLIVDKKHIDLCPGPKSTCSSSVADVLRLLASDFDEIDSDACPVTESE